MSNCLMHRQTDGTYRCDHCDILVDACERFEIDCPRDAPDLSNNMIVRFQTCRANALIPVRSTPGSAGFDMYASQSGEIPPGQRKLVSTGVQCAIPDGYVGLIRPRSSLALHHGIDVMAGVIDSDYRGEVHALLINLGFRTFQYEAYDRVAQMVVVPFHGQSVQVGDLDDTARGTGGYGSTGR